MLLSLLARLSRFAPHPAHVAALVLAVVAIHLDSNALIVICLGVCLYGMAYELTEPEPELLHVYCPCEICDPFADQNGGGV